jgi:isopenicillin-N epimerase
MHSRRDFVRAGTLAGASLLVGCRHQVLHGLDPAIDAADEDPVAAASDEAFWRSVRGAFDLDERIINLHAGVSPSPRDVHDALEREARSVNRAPTYHMRDWPALGRREDARIAAADALGCDPEELAITRSATESLQIAQLGIDLTPGDEVLTTREEYPSMWNAWQQRVQREGIVHREIDLGAPYPPMEEIVQRFEQAITPRTRVIMFCDLTWATGHLLPVQEICALARSRGIQTIIDGAHGFGHIPFRVRDLGCDYYGTSGHKWLQAPLGTGLLYVRRERIRNLWPLMPMWEEPFRDDIRKFEFVGDRSPAHHNSIAGAVRFLMRLGVERKAARLHYLKQRWVEQLSGEDRVHMLTDPASGRSCGIASFCVQGIDSKSLAAHLLDRHDIFVSTPEDDWHPADEAMLDGRVAVRVAPNVFTSAWEIDRFVEAVHDVLQSGLPADR